MKNPLEIAGKDRQPLQRATAWVTSDAKVRRMGVIQGPFYFVGAFIHITESFDDTATLDVGDDDTADGFIDAEDITAGPGVVAAPVLGSFKGYNSTGRNIVTAVSGSPTQGKALLTIEYFRVPISP